MLRQSPVFIEKIKKLLINSPEALQFLFVYAEYISVADDCVDEEKSILALQKLTALAAHLYNLPYWIKYHDRLFMIECLNNLAYFDSVAWEKSDDKTKKQVARVLSHSGYNMLYAVLILELGFEATRELSDEIRTIGHQHLIYKADGTFITPKDSPLSNET